MASEIITSNLNPSVTPSPNNISSLLSGDITKTVIQTSPSTFGPQIPKISNNLIVATAAQSIILRLYKEKAELIIEDQTLDIEHIKTLQTLEQKYTPKKTINNEFKSELTDEEYQDAVNTENNNYKLEIYADSHGRYYSNFKTDFIHKFYESLRVIAADPTVDEYQIEDGEIHIKEQTLKSKLLQVMYNEL